MISKNLCISFVLSLCILLFSPSCSKPSNKNSNLKTLRVNTLTEPPTIDPRKTEDCVSAQVVCMNFDGLVRVDKNGDPTLSLAESYSVDKDYKTYTFILREAYWSDGKQLTAFDFEETWKTILSPEFPALMCYSFYVIKNAKLAKEGGCSVDEIGVKALDDKTLKVTLESSAPYFLSLLLSSCYKAYPNRVAKINEAFMEDHKKPFVSSGPFTITSWQSGNQIVTEKSTTYWDKESVNLERIILSFVQDHATELSLYEQGEIDWIGQPLSFLPADALPILKERDDYYDYDISGVYHYAFNTEAFPFTNKNIRKAFAYAINRKELIDHVTQANHSIANALIPHKKTNNTLADGDKDAANRFLQKGLEELGITKDELPKITLSYNYESNMNYKLAQAIQEQWRHSLGIDVNLQCHEWKVYLDMLNKGDFQIARLGLAALYSDPQFYLEWFTHSWTFNCSRWINSSFLEIFKALQSESQHEKREYLTSQAESIFLDEMPIAPVFFYKNSYLKKPYLHDVRLDPLNNVDFKWADIRESDL